MKPSKLTKKVNAVLQSSELRSIVVSTIFILFMLFLFLQGLFVDQQAAIDVLEAHGYSDIIITAEARLFVPALGVCRRYDFAMFDATAKDPNGNEIDVTVCIGVGKDEEERTLIVLR